MLAYFSMRNVGNVDDRLLIELANPSHTNKPANKCVVARKIADLRPDVQEVVERLLASNKSHRELHQALSRAGFKVDRAYLSYHRTGTCTCGEPNA